MTVLDLSPRDRWVLGTGVVAVTAIVAIGRGLPAARVWNATRVDSAALLAGELASARLAHRRLHLTRTSLAIARQRSAQVDSSMLIAASPSAGAALLASLVADAADSSGVKIIATQLRADSSASAPLARVSVRVAAVGDVAGLLEFLRALEAGDVVMCIEEVTISSSDPAAPDDKPEALRAEVVITGLSRVPNSKL